MQSIQLKLTQENLIMKELLKKFNNVFFKEEIIILLNTEMISYYI